MTEVYEHASIRVEMASDATIRDYFAAKVMQGDWVSQSAEVGYFTPKSTDKNLDNAAELYYRMADAMLRAREK